MRRASRTRTARERARSAAGRPRTSSAAGSRAGRRARSRSIDHLEVDILERRGDDANAVDLLTRGDELAHDPRHVVAARVGEALRAGGSVDLDSALVAQVVRRAGRDDPTVVDDHDAVADELDLREQVRVEQYRDSALAQLLEQATHDTPPGGI